MMEGRLVPVRRKQGAFGSDPEKGLGSVTIRVRSWMGLSHVGQPIRQDLLEEHTWLTAYPHRRATAGHICA